MASSGWQGELFATNSCFSDYVMWNVNVRIDSVMHSGTNLVITGIAAWCTRNKPGKSGGSTTFGASYPCGLTPQGGQYYEVVAGGVRQNVGTDYYTPSFTVTIPNVAESATSYTYSCTWAAPGNNTGAYGGTTGGTVSWTLSFDPSTPPVHLYGSVNGARKEIKHLYGSVNGSRKKIKKLYGSVNGARKLIFEDNS